MIVERHRTAISRTNLSKPLQIAARHGYLQGDWTVFDYGCGKGQDVLILESAGITATGWDPFFNPESPLNKSDLVNLGFVLNVIENNSERITALQKAVTLAQRLLIVSIITEHSRQQAEHIYADGNITNRNTFQKYFTNQEITDLIETATGLQPITVAPGVFFVFVDKIDEQRFLSNRYRKKQDISHLLTLKPPSVGTSSWADWNKFQTNQITLTELWKAMLSFGRLPSLDEIPITLAEVIKEQFTSIRRAAETAQIGFKPSDFLHARASRIEDLKVYFAMNIFNKRTPYTQLEASLQRDVKTFFGSYTSALEKARDLLFSIGDKSIILNTCIEAHEKGLGFLDGQHSLQIHKDLVDKLSSELRIYIACAEKLYGDIEQSDIVKIHIQSSKVTFLEYADFERTAVPHLNYRIKVDLGGQDVDYFDYTNDPTPQPLYLKSRYMDANQTGFNAQKRFDKKLEKLGVFDFSGFGPDADTFAQGLEALNLSVRGKTLVKSQKTASSN